MPDALPENMQIFVDWNPQLMKLMRTLAQRDWFVEDGWSMFIGSYHAGIFAQWTKGHWHNQALEGVHFEAGIDPEALQRKVLSLDLHVGHRNLFDRAAFNERTVEAMAELVERWRAEGAWPRPKKMAADEDPVWFSKTNLSERLRVQVPFTKGGFATQVADALERAVELAPIVDEGLEGL